MCHMSREVLREITYSFPKHSSLSQQYAAVSSETYHHLYERMQR